MVNAVKLLNRNINFTIQYNYRGAIDYGRLYGECDYGGCDYGECDYGGCVSVRVWPMS